MRLTLPRVALAALVLAMPPALYAFAQDQAPSSAPASAEPSAAPSSAPAPASSEPAAPASSEPQSGPQDQPADEPIVPAAKPDRHPRSSEEIYKDLDFFGQVFDRIRAEYVDPPDEQELIRAAIQGMLTSLDPHSSYMDPAEFDQTQQDTSGQFGGLGIEVTMEEGVIKVVSPIDDTPAQKAGILANDYIVELDGKSVQGISIDEAVAKMKGPVGTKIKLTVIREGQQKPLYFELTRDIIAQQVVKSSMEGDVAVLRLTRFTEQAYPGIQKAIKDLYAQNKGVAPKGIILDLRNNPGGLVDQAVYVADAFLKEGAVVLTRGRTDAESTRYDAKPDDLDAKLADVPLVVLINGGSASAAEIVAGALQDHKRATLIGTRSFGKGSVQSIIHMGDNGGIRLTTARYYTPNNRSIQAAGIQPDIVITENVPDDLKGRDEILGEAGLNGQIGGGTAPEATTGSSVYIPPDKKDDTQLQYAIRLIDGLETNAAFPPKAEG
ncbi:MAG TPA: S41 family peptidase [Devosia sp.]|nr:S41 family peptidase [Devosia sp.]